MMRPTTDTEIRAALHAKRLCKLRDSQDALIIDELGLSHAKVRVDIAVINGCVHGFEIKSSADTLNRLPSQLDIYSKCLSKLTIVCAPNHTFKVMRNTPNWCGILEADKGMRGGIHFRSIRRTGTNPHIELDQLAHLLWRSEARELLSRYDSVVKVERLSRKQLYTQLASFVTIKELVMSIRQFMLIRQDWRAPPVHA